MWSPGQGSAQGWEMQWLKSTVVSRIQINTQSVLSFISPFHKSKLITFRCVQSCSDLFIVSGFLTCLPQDAAKFSKGNQVLKMRLSCTIPKTPTSSVCLLSSPMAKDKIDGIKQRSKKLQQHLKIQWKLQQQNTLSLTDFRMKLAAVSFSMKDVYLW